MSTRKQQLNLVTIPEFLEARPEFTESQVRWAIRNRHDNGLAKFTFRRRTGKRNMLIELDLYTAHLFTPVPA